MKRKVRKRYEKPRVTKVRLEEKVSVLAACKSSVGAGPPDVSGCEPLGPCSSTTGS